MNFKTPEHLKCALIFLVNFMFQNRQVCNDFKYKQKQEVTSQYFEVRP